MPESFSLLRRQTGKTLWSMALTFWLSVSPAQAEELSWALDVARSHIAKTKGWSETDYHLRIVRRDPDRVVVYARHEDDDSMGKLNSQGFIRAGGGKSFEIVLSQKTRGVIWEWYFQ